MDNSVECFLVRTFSDLCKCVGGGISYSLVRPLPGYKTRETEGENPDTFLPYPFWMRWDFFCVCAQQKFNLKIFNMKQNVLEKTDYLVPSCKAIDVRLEGALCGSYGDPGMPGSDGRYEGEDEFDLY